MLEDARAGRVGRWLPDPAHEAELGHPSTRLAAYGTLRPGEANAHVLAGIPGHWRPGVVRGRLTTWHGYPALIWAPDGDPVPVQVLESPELSAHWPRIDAFEGPAYRRVWLEVELADGGVVVASCYERA